MTTALKAKPLGNIIHFLRLNIRLGVMAPQGLMHLLKSLNP